MRIRTYFSRLNDYSRNGVIAGLSGILLIVPVLGFMMCKSYEQELALIDHAKVVHAELVNASAGGSADPRAGDVNGASGTYRYTMLDGKEGTISISADSLDELPCYADNAVVEVEYLPENPMVARIKGDGNQNISDLKFWTVFKGVLLSLFFLMSVALTVSGLRNG